MDTEKINHMKSEKSDIFSPVLQSQIGELFFDGKFIKMKKVGVVA